MKNYLINGIAPYLLWKVSLDDFRTDANMDGYIDRDNDYGIRILERTILHGNPICRYSFVKSTIQQSDIINPNAYSIVWSSVHFNKELYFDVNHKDSFLASPGSNDMLYLYFGVWDYDDGDALDEFNEGEEIYDIGYSTEDYGITTLSGSDCRKYPTYSLQLESSSSFIGEDVDNWGVLHFRSQLIDRRNHQNLKDSDIVTP